jgi:hypothetical protein
VSSREFVRSKRSGNQQLEFAPGLGCSIMMDEPLMSFGICLPLFSYFLGSLLDLEYPFTPKIRKGTETFNPFTCISSGIISGAALNVGQNGSVDAHSEWFRRCAGPLKGQ